METQRIALHTILEPRDSSLSKDGELINCYSEENPEGIMVVKRGGLNFLSTVCNGVGQGAFYFNGMAVFVGCDTLMVARVQTLTTHLKAGAA